MTRTWTLPLLVGLAVAALQLSRAATNTISPYDEGYHLSYVQYIGDGHVPHVGDPLNTWSREAFSCHPVFPFGAVTKVPCGEVAEPRLYPEGGTNTAAGWPPVYYVYAAAVTRPLAAFGVEPLYGARTASALLWAAGALALVLVARRFGANSAAAASAGLIAGAVPAADTLGAFVTPHSAQLLLSVVIAATVLALMRRTDRLRRRDALAGVGVPALAVMVVPHALVAVAIAYIALALHWVQRAARRTRVRGLGWVVLLGPWLAATANELWKLAVDARTTAYTAGAGADQAQSLADPRGDAFLPPLVAQWWHFWPEGLRGDTLGFSSWELFVATAAVMLAAGAVGVALLSPTPSPLARALAVGLIVAAPLSAWAAERTFAFVVPARYGASVIGIALLILALTVARGPSRPLLVFSVVIWAAAFLAQWP